MHKRSILIFLSLVFVAGLTTSCILDPKETKTPTGGDNKVVYKDLKEKDDVLYNLELAYNERNMTQYDKLLDDAFIFIFSPEDFSSGQTPAQWDRNAEVVSNTKILDPNLAGDKRVIQIDLSLDYPADNWAEQPENEDHPGESWYTNTVDYDLIVKTADDWEHRALDLKAEFTIRWAGTPEDGHWRIILWRDDVGN
jgi:hypothetical protein